MLPKDTLIQSHGFTLIELLIVIAVIGILAVALLFFIDPAEQIRQSRDTGRKTGIKQLSNAAESYRLINNEYPPSIGFPNNWITENFVRPGELKNAPKRIQLPSSMSFLSPAPGQPCNGVSNQNDWCLNTSASGAFSVIFTRLESRKYQQMCDAAVTTFQSAPFYAWSSSLGRAGVICRDPMQPWYTNIGPNCTSPPVQTNYGANCFIFLE